MISPTSPARKLTAIGMPTRRLTAAVPSLPLPPLQGYLFALLMLSLAWLLSFASHVFIGPSLPALPFVMAIVVAAGVGGLNPGLFATAVGFAVVYYNFHTRDIGSYPAARAVLTLVFFAFLGVMISVLCELLYRYRREALRQARFCEEAHDAIFAWRLEGPVLYWNRAANELYGFDRAAAFSATTHPLLGAKNRAAFEEVKATLQRTGQWMGELSHHTSDGREVRVESRMRLITAGTERSTVVEADRDVTERMHTVTALREADRRKDEFLATLAHEIRNPLAPIRNELEILRVSRGNSELIERSRAVMERQLAHLVHLVDDLMDVSRITRGKLELRREKLSLDAALQVAAETSRPLIEAAHHSLVLNLPPQPLYVLGDLTRLAQIFSNLLNNAAKYTPPGGRITLTARREEREAVIEIRDSGVGIAAEALPDIFEMFAQANRARGLAHGGLGIGLALVHGLTEMHGGTVHAQSEGVGLGSTFTVRLPVVEVHEHEIPSAQPAVVNPAVARRRVLVADDNLDAAESLAMLLTMMGHEVHAVHDGAQAVEQADQFRPDLILMDVGMPKLDGLQAATQIRSFAWGASPVIVALTGWGQEADRQRSKAAGCDEHLVKPLDFERLSDLLARLAERPRPA
jgi:PAS domain S-box-containing protein